MTTVVHPTALLSPDAQIGEGVRIGAYAIVGEQCVIGDGCVLAPRATLERNVTLGRSVSVGIGSILGGDPQDLKFDGEETDVEIGEGTVIREYATINRGTAQSRRTSVGRNCLIMSYVHLAHDCHVGDHVIIGNGSQFAGHVTIQDRATISGLWPPTSSRGSAGTVSWAGCRASRETCPPLCAPRGIPSSSMG